MRSIQLQYAFRSGPNLTPLWSDVSIVETNHHHLMQSCHMVLVMNPKGLCMLLNSHVRQSGNTPRASDGLQEDKFGLPQEGEGTGTESIKATTCIQCVAILSCSIRIT
jgi:hypothetical protein